MIRQHHGKDSYFTSLKNYNPGVNYERRSPVQYQSRGDPAQFNSEGQIMHQGSEGKFKNNRMSLMDQARQYEKINDGTTNGSSLPHQSSIGTNYVVPTRHHNTFQMADNLARTQHSGFGRNQRREGSGDAARLTLQNFYLEKQKSMLHNKSSRPVVTKKRHNFQQ